MDRGGPSGPNGPQMGQQGPNAMIVTPQNHKYPFASHGYNSFGRGATQPGFFEQQQTQFLDLDRDHDPDFGMNPHHQAGHD